MFSTALKHIYTQFPALQYKNYRLYFAGQLISFTGSWLHGVAQGWLVFTLTHSPFWLGVIGAVSALPVLFLSLFGGVLVDKFNRKKLLFMTQSTSLLLAFTLGILTITGLINLPWLIILTFLSGVANALDNPASQAFVVDIVNKDDLPSAIGLNATIFNTGRVLGPAVAGFLIGIVGVGNIFFINALSFLAILVSLYFIKVHFVATPKNEKPIQAIREAVAYSLSNPLLSKLLLTAGMGAIFCFSQATLMPIFATQTFSQSASGLGLLLSATGLGALCASLVISSHYKKIKSSYFIMVGYITFLISSFGFSFTSNIYFGAAFLFFSGFGLTLQFSTIYATIQKIVKEEFRGRISSMYVLLFVGFSPLGNLFIGSAASLLGTQMALRLCLYIMFVYGIIMYMHIGKGRGEYQKFAQKIRPLFNLAFVNK